jgi:hypothetical protein
MYGNPIRDHLLAALCANICAVAAILSLIYWPTADQELKGLCKGVICAIGIYDLYLIAVCGIVALIVGTLTVSTKKQLFNSSN